MSDRNTFSAGLGAKVCGGFADEDGTPTELNLLAEKPEIIRGVLAVIRGLSEIKPIEYLIDFDAKPSVPNGWEILPESEQLPNRVRGKMQWNSTKVKLHLDAGQKSEKFIVGNNLRKQLDKVPVYGAQLGDFYFANQNHIPEEYKGKAIFFWGTIYRNSDGHLYVRYLNWNGVRWVWFYRWLHYIWGSNDPAALSAS